MHFAKTRPLILEILSQGNQKPTRDWREARGPGLEGQSRSFGWLHYVLYSIGSCQNSEHTPNWLKYNKHIPGPSENDLWIISPIWLFIPPLPFFWPGWLKSICSQGGCLQMSQRWSWWELVGRTVDPGPRWSSCFGPVVKSQRGLREVTSPLTSASFRRRKHKWA